MLVCMYVYSGFGDMRYKEGRKGKEEGESRLEKKKIRRNLLPVGLEGRR